MIGIAPAKRASAQKAANVRRALFVEAYLTNGMNATKAAIACGLSRKTATSSGQRMLKRPDIAAMVAERARTIVTEARLSTERWARELASIAHFDPGELYRPDGTLIPLRELPEHVRRAIASVEPASHGGVKIKFWDKLAALDKIGKHLGLLKGDDQQKVEPIHVTVSFVGKVNGPAQYQTPASRTARISDGL